MIQGTLWFGATACICTEQYKPSPDNFITYKVCDNLNSQKKNNKKNKKKQGELNIKTFPFGKRLRRINLKQAKTIAKIRTKNKNNNKSNNNKKQQK